MPAAILASWERCQALGLGPGEVDLPYVPGVVSEAQELLVRASAPVLERLHGLLVGTKVCVVLTDARARVLVRRAGEPGLNRHLDAVQLAEGFSYREADAGTNGMGTALVEGRLSVVLGREHFADRFVAFACAGVPIRDPFSGRIRGVVDLTSWSRDANPLMAALVSEAAENIELRLLEQYSARERALVAEARRNGGGAAPGRAWRWCGRNSRWTAVSTGPGTGAADGRPGRSDATASSSEARRPSWSRRPGGTW
ncbi:hypothetical protein ACFQ9X_30980 [Catenulispora yoronensis]